MNEGTLIRVEDVRCLFKVRRTASDLLKRHANYVHAVDSVTFTVEPGEIIALVGESGCGKSTIGRLLVNLETPTSGQVLFDDQDISELKGDELKKFRRRAQIIFQNPYEAFDPRLTIRTSLMQAMRIHALYPLAERESRIADVLRRSGLSPARDFLDRYPHELSGGQAQRIATARAMLLEPEFLVADEPVSMLDVSVRADILNQLLDHRDRYQMAIMFITHDLAVARYVADRVAVMYLGMIVEYGPAHDIIDQPKHPYSQALLSHTLPVDDDERTLQPIQIGTEVPTPVNLTPGCRFANRCPYVFDRCRVETPQLRRVSPTQDAACHLYDN